MGRSSPSSHKEAKDLLSSNAGRKFFFFFERSAFFFFFRRNRPSARFLLLPGYVPSRVRPFLFPFDLTSGIQKKPVAAVWMYFSWFHREE